MKHTATVTLSCLCAAVLVVGLSLQANARSVSDPITGEAGFVLADTTGAPDDTDERPEAFALHQNYPNPFNPTTSVRYEVASRSDVRLVVYDMLGKQVATLVNREHLPGTYRVNFDASSLSSGVYILSMKAQDGFHAVRRMVLTK